MYTRISTYMIPHAYLIQSNFSSENKKNSNRCANEYVGLEVLEFVFNWIKIRGQKVNKFVY